MKYPIVSATFLLAAPIAAGAQNTSGDTNPYNFPDDSYISVNGEVKSVNPDSFVMDFGEGEITVEMDDGDRDADAYVLLQGDKVTVNGRIDDDLFETKKIEAGSVYVDKLQTHFYSSNLDEEDFAFLATRPAVVVDPLLMVQGRVNQVSDSSFTVETGSSDVTIEVDELAYDPLDDEGYQRIQAGDIVSIVGDVDYSFLEGHELVASSIVKIDSSQGQQSSQQASSTQGSQQTDSGVQSSQRQQQGSQQQSGQSDSGSDRDSKDRSGN